MNQRNRITIILLISLLFSQLCGATNVAREKARRINCAGNLKQIGFALIIYAADHDGHFPDRLEQLHDHKYLTAGKVYHCPSTWREKPDSPLSGAGIDDFSACDYLYLGPPPVGLSPEESAKWPVACDMSYNHHPDFRPPLSERRNPWINILYADGHVKGEPIDDLQAYAEENGWQVPIPKKPEFVAPVIPFNILPILTIGGIIGLIIFIFGISRLRKRFGPGTGTAIGCLSIAVIIILIGILLPAL